MYRLDLYFRLTHRLTHSCMVLLCNNLFLICLTPDDFTCPKILRVILWAKSVISHLFYLFFKTWKLALRWIVLSGFCATGHRGRFLTIVSGKINRQLESCKYVVTNYELTTQNLVKILYNRPRFISNFYSKGNFYSTGLSLQGVLKKQTLLNSPIVRIWMA